MITVDSNLANLSNVDVSSLLGGPHTEVHFLGSGKFRDRKVLFELLGSCSVKLKKNSLDGSFSFSGAGLLRFHDFSFLSSLNFRQSCF